MFNREIKNATLLLAVGTAALYAYGLSFYQGYLGYWGIEESLFELSFERLIFQGFSASGLAALKILGPFVLSAVCFAFFVWLFQRFRKAAWVKRWIASSVDDKVGAEKSETLSVLVAVFTAAYFTLVALIVAWFLLLLAGVHGRSVAEDQHVSWATTPERQIYVTLDSGRSFKAHSITCANAHCAYLSEQEVVVYPVSSIAVVQSAPKTLPLLQSSVAK